MTPQQGLVGEGLLDLACHPVVGVNHALGHGLVDLQGLPGDQGCDVFVFVQLGLYLKRKEGLNKCLNLRYRGPAVVGSNLHSFQLQCTPSVPVGAQVPSHLSQHLQSLG